MQPEPKPKRKQTDAEKVLDMIHCIDDEDEKKNAATVHPFMKPDLGNKPPNMRIPHYGGAFEGVIDGPKTYRQTFSYQMVRKPEGTYTTSTVVDPSGNTKTVIKRTIDGETKTQTLVNGVDIDDANGGGMVQAAKQSNNWIIDCGRHFYVNKDGYALPKNLFWLEIWQLSIKRIASYNYYSNNHYQALVVVVLLFLCLTKRNQVKNTSATLTTTAATPAKKNIKMKKNPNDSTAVNSTSSKTVHVKYTPASREEGDPHSAKCRTFIHVIIVTKIRWKQLFIKFYLKFDYDYLKFNQCYDFR